MSLTKPKQSGSGLSPIAASTLLGNNTGSAAVPSALSAAQVRTLLGLATDSSPTFSGLTLTGLQSFTGTSSVGLRLKSLTSVEYGLLIPGTGDLFVDSTTDRIDARLARGSVELIDSAGGQTINGALTATGTVTASGTGTHTFGTTNTVTMAAGLLRAVNMAATTSVGVNNRMALSGGASDGNGFLTDWSTATTFGRLGLGPLTSAFPALKRSGTTVAIRLGDDSADAPITCSNLTASGTVATNTIGTASGSTLTINNDGNSRWVFNAGEFNVAGQIVPNANNVRQLGTTSNRWSTVFGVAGDFSGNLTASGTVTGVTATGTGSLNNYSFISGNAGSATGDTWRLGKGWSGNYDTQFIFAYGDNAAKVTIDSTGAITAFGGYYVNVPAGSGTSIRPVQHGNSFVRFSAPASGIPGNHIAVEGWDSVLINASTGVIRNRIGGSDRLVLSNTDLTLTGNFTASGTVTASPTSTASSGVAANLTLNTTYNQTGTAGSTDLNMVRTETALGSGSHNYIRCVTNSVFAFAVDRVGNVSSAGNVTASGNGTFGSGTSFPIGIGQDAGRGGYLASSVGGTAFGFCFSSANIIFPCNATAPVTNTISLGRADYQFLNVFSQNVTASGTVTAHTTVKIGTAGAGAPGFFPFTGNTYTTPDAAGRGLSLYSYMSAAGSTSIALGGEPFSATSGTNTHLLIARNFAPTSGTGVFSLATITTTINQTGGANGITRGLFINPTLTAAADFRGIDVGDCGSQTAIRTGTGLVSFGDSVSITGNLTTSGKITGSASITARASLNLPHGVAPTSPVDGDVWTATTGAFVRINGVTNQLQKAITSGTAAPSGGVDGDIYLQYT